MADSSAKKISPLPMEGVGKMKQIFSWITWAALIIFGLFTLAQALETTRIQVKRGNDATMPTKFAMGEPAFTTDTHRVFFGTSTSRIELQRALGYTPVNTTDLRLSDARSPLAHDQAINTVIGLSAALAGKTDNLAFDAYTAKQRALVTDPRFIDSRTPLPHNQGMETINGLQTVLADKEPVGTASGLVTAHDSADAPHSAAGFAKLNQPATFTTLNAAATSATVTSGVALAGSATTGIGVVGQSGSSYGGYFTSGGNSNVAAVYGSGTASATGIKGSSVTGKGAIITSTSGTVAELSMSGALTAHNSNSVVAINRSNSGAVNLTGDIIKIIDNPTTSTATGALISAYIGTTERFRVDPRVANSAGNVATIIDTSQAITNAKLLSLRNNGVEKLAVDADGAIQSPTITSLQSGLDSKEAANANIQAHIADRSNWHVVTASQTGAEPHLGSPDADGKVLSSTAMGVRLWVDPPAATHNTIVAKINETPADDTLPLQYKKADGSDVFNIDLATGTVTITGTLVIK